MSTPENYVEDTVQKTMTQIVCDGRSYDCLVAKTDTGIGYYYSLEEVRDSNTDEVTDQSRKDRILAKLLDRMKVFQS